MGQATMSRILYNGDYHKTQNDSDHDDGCLKHPRNCLNSNGHAHPKHKDKNLACCETLEN